MIKYQLLLAAALLTGVAIGFFAGGPHESTPTGDDESVHTPLIADKGDEATVKALRHRIAELEKALAEKQVMELGTASVTSVVEMVQTAARSMESTWRDRIEELKQRDPERYEQMKNRFAQWRQRRAEQARSKIEFLASIDTAHMDAEAKKTHAALQELIAQREEIEEQLQDPDLSFEERGSLMRQLWESHGELQRLNGEERQNLIEVTAKQLGFEGEDAKDVSFTIQEVIRATDSGWGGGRHGGPRGPGGPGGR